jgi:hypothetical protein
MLVPMPEFGATRPGGINRPVVAGSSTQSSIGIATVPFRARRPRATAPTPRPQDVDSAATGASQGSAPHRSGLRFIRKDGLEDRATGPGDACSGGGAWLSSPGPTHPSPSRRLPPGGGVCLSAARLILIGVAAAALLLSASQALAAEPRSDASSISRTAEPTYVSELGPAVSIGPREAGELPAAGSGGSGSTVPVRALGLATAVGGGALIYASRAMRPHTA